MHTFEEKTFLSLLTQRHAPHYFGEIQLRLIFILQPPYLQRYADAVTGKGAPLYNCFDVLTLLVKQLLVFVDRF